MSRHFDSYTTDQVGEAIAAGSDDDRAYLRELFADGVELTDRELIFRIGCSAPMLAAIREAVKSGI